MEMIMNGIVDNRVYKEIITVIISVYIQLDICLDSRPVFSSLYCNTP